MSATELPPDPPPPGWEPAPLPTEGARCWRVWAACRGSSALLAQIARAAAWEVARVDGAAACLTEVAVRDDVERVLSPHEVADKLSPEALRRFRWIRVRARGKTVGVDVLAAREPVDAPGGRELAWDQVPAVVLEVAAPDAETARRVRDAVAGAIDRGSFAVLRAKPGVGEGREGVGEWARADVKERRELVGGLYALTTLAVLGLVWAVARLARDFAYGDDAVAAAVAAAVLAYAVALGVSARRPRFSARVRRRLDRVFFPAVEIADRTPGRRVLRLGFRVASLALVPLAGALAQQIGRAMGLLG